MNKHHMLCVADDDWQQLIADTLDDTTEDALNRSSPASSGQESDSDTNPICNVTSRSERIKRGGPKPR